MNFHAKVRSALNLLTRSYFLRHGKIPDLDQLGRDLPEMVEILQEEEEAVEGCQKGEEVWISIVR